MLTSFNLKINVQITLIMVQTRTENPQDNTKSSFGETIDTLEDCNIKNIRHNSSWKKE